MILMNKVNKYRIYRFKEFKIILSFRGIATQRKATAQKNPSEPKALPRFDSDG